VAALARRVPPPLKLATNNESLYKISTLMGNSPKICRRHYAVLMPEAMVETVEFVGQLLVPDAERIVRRIGS